MPIINLPISKQFIKDENVYISAENYIQVFYNSYYDMYEIMSVLFPIDVIDNFPVGSVKLFVPSTYNGSQGVKKIMAGLNIAGRTSTSTPLPQEFTFPKETERFSSTPNDIYYNTYVGGKWSTYSLQLIKEIVFEEGITHFSGVNSFPFLEKIVLPTTLTHFVRLSASSSVGFFSANERLKEVINFPTTTMATEYPFVGRPASEQTENFFYSSMFSNCSFLENVYLMPGLTGLPNSYFNGTRIKNIVLPNSYTYLGSSSLGSVCLESFNFPTSLVEDTTLNSLTPINGSVSFSLWENVKPFTEISIPSIYTNGLPNFIYKTKKIIIPKETVGSTNFNGTFVNANNGGGRYVTFLEEIEVDVANPNYSTNTNKNLLLNKTKSTLISCVPVLKSTIDFPATITTWDSNAFRGTISEVVDTITIPSNRPVNTNFTTSTNPFRFTKYFSNYNGSNPQIGNIIRPTSILSKLKIENLTATSWISNQGAFDLDITSTSLTSLNHGTLSFGYNDYLKGIVYDLSINLSHPQNILNLGFNPDGSSPFLGLIDQTFLSQFSGVTNLSLYAFSKLKIEHLDLSIFPNLNNVGQESMNQMAWLKTINFGNRGLTQSGANQMLDSEGLLEEANLGNHIWTSAGNFFRPFTTETRSFDGKSNRNLPLHTFSVRLRTTYGATTGSYVKRFFGASAFNTALFLPNALKTINLTFEATTMPQYACYGVDTVETVNIPLTTTVLGANGLEGCIKLLNHTLPTSATIIPVAYMKGCSSMTTLTVPANYTAISSEAFSGMTSMAQYTFERTTPPTLASSNVFTGIPPTCVIRVPSASLTAYQTATNWSVYASQMVGY